MELGSGILGAEAPVDGGLGGVALGLVGADGSSQIYVVAVASLQTGSGQYAELDFRHVQPAGVLGGVVKLETFHDAPG